MKRSPRDEEGLAIGFISLSDILLVGLIFSLLYVRSAATLTATQDLQLKSNEALLSSLARELSQCRSAYRRAAVESQLSVVLPPLPKTSSPPNGADLPTPGTMLSESQSLLESFHGEIDRSRKSESAWRQQAFKIQTDRDLARRRAREHLSDAILLSETIDDTWKLLSEANALIEQLKRTSEIQLTDLKQARAELDRVRAELKSARAELTRAHAERDSAHAELESARGRLRSALTQLDELRARLIDLQQRRDRVALIAGEHYRDVATFGQLIDDLNVSLQQRKSLPKELLGVRGDLKRVVFVVDCSYSMNNVAPIALDPARDNKESWWQVVTDTITLWIRTLPMESAMIVYFSDDVTVFPKSKSFLTIENDQAQLIRSVKEHGNPKIGAATNTLLALRTAFDVKEADTIVLFTDGEPNRTPDRDSITTDQITADRKKNPQEYAKQYSRACWNQILDYVEKQQSTGRKIPINVVALGNYFDGLYGPSLVRLATMTGGSFLGRGGTQANEFRE